MAGKHARNTASLPSPDMDVALVRWPEEQLRRTHLRSAGEPVLLLVESHVPPPEVDDWLEDWVRLPAVDEDPAHLGESLVLPPWLEGHRAQITAALPPLHLPAPAARP